MGPRRVYLPVTQPRIQPGLDQSLETTKYCFRSTRACPRPVWRCFDLLLCFPFLLYSVFGCTCHPWSHRAFLAASLLSYLFYPTLNMVHRLCGMVAGARTDLVFALWYQRLPQGRETSPPMDKAIVLVGERVTARSKCSDYTSLCLCSIRYPHGYPYLRVLHYGTL